MRAGAGGAQNLCKFVNLSEKPVNIYKLLPTKLLERKIKNPWAWLENFHPGEPEENKYASTTL